MLRVGLTGGLGSGKSTVAAMLAQKGAFIIEADELGRRLMEPGQHVYAQILAHFGHQVLAANGQLDRKTLAKLAFVEGRVQELNAIVHPATIAAQQEWMRNLMRTHPEAVAIVESALIFEVERDARARGECEGLLADWRSRFDRIVVVTAPDDLCIARYIKKLTPPGLSSAPLAHLQAHLAADALARIARQIPQQHKAARADFILENKGDDAALQRQVDSLWSRLKELQAASSPTH